MQLGVPDVSVHDELEGSELLAGRCPDVGWSWQRSRQVDLLFQLEGVRHVDGRGGWRSELGASKALVYLRV